MKKASVPLFAEGDLIVMGSFEIAKHAESIGRKSPLLPADKVQDIARWVEVAEQMTNTGRAWVLKRIARSREAQAEALPSFIPRALRTAAAPTSALAVRFLESKYDVPEDVEAEIARTLRPLLEEVRAALGGRPYLLSTFSFADMAIAATMQVLRPREGSKLGPAMREAWTNEPLARDFEDLVKWRDAIYAKHR